MATRSPLPSRAGELAFTAKADGGSTVASNGDVSVASADKVPGATVSVESSTKSARSMLLSRPRGGGRSAAPALPPWARQPVVLLRVRYRRGSPRKGQSLAYAKGRRCIFQWRLTPTQQMRWRRWKSRRRQSPLLSTSTNFTTIVVPTELTGATIAIANREVHWQRRQPTRISRHQSPTALVPRQRQERRAVSATLRRRPHPRAARVVCTTASLRSGSATTACAEPHPSPRCKHRPRVRPVPGPRVRDAHRRCWANTN